MPRSSQRNLSTQQHSRPGAWHAVQSSRVTEIRYDPGLREVHVIFRDGTPWTYQGVPEDVYARFVSSDSPGTFINNVLNGYPYHRGGFDYASYSPDEE